jgi:flavin-dependent dehydrogenase
VRLIKNARVKNISRNTQSQTKQWQVEYAEQYLDADFIIDASGRNSKFSSRLKVKKIQYDQLVGVSFMARINTPKLNQFESGNILIEAINKGWWYLSNLDNKNLIATFISDANIVKSYGSVSTSLHHFIDASIQVKQYLSHCDIDDKLYVRAAKTQILSCMVGKHWLAVGDAAWSVDPLSSQGLFKGINMGMEAAEAIYSDTLQKYQESNYQKFYRYIKQRLHYYRLETRWHNENFWKMHGTATWLDENIKINPFDQVNFQLNTKNHLGSKQQLEIVTPAIDIDLLIELLQAASHSKSIYTVVKHYREQSRYFIEDKQIIITIQLLLN